MLHTDEEATNAAKGGGGGWKAAAVLTQGILTMNGEKGQQLWFTELHLDLFRIVNEHVELGIGTGIEVCVCARRRSTWRSLRLDLALA